MKAIVLGAILLAGAVSAAEPTAAPAAKKAACSAAEFRQFDFWIGDWTVTAPDGKPAGRNRISAILDGCAISEEWTGAGGSNGRSHSAWDASNRRWNQYWVDDDAMVLYLSGGLQGSSLVLSGEQVDPASGKRSPQRVSWTPNADGSVRQLWQGSSDGGKTWATVFEGVYRKK
ncbi:hypothetical protein DFR29_111153 [Tahibacter aquaticus]|uniref:DUF1579 domain-containing protein n=1 Tax=Tahibacter aquaticus TaxID=520092 RepID=A0A4R6YSL1_9GAMM|nr:hypothetical protein [Tahibacter aquaticus]TDR41239.1 hypothetical protein DFR29_111153 [Tahibacter aquaticus]